MHHFKYYDQFALAKPLAEMMLSTLSELSAEPPDLLIPIPLHTQRERERGYNQSNLIARELSKATGIPAAERGLRRIRATEVQAKLDLQERIKNVEGVFALGDVEVTHKRVCLIDDVCTTGATLFSAADCLKSAGAARVTGLTFARALKI